MSHELPSPLPRYDRNLLSAVARIVPASERVEWSRIWQAELWHMHHRGHPTSRWRRTLTVAMTTDLSIGLTRDALWLRGEGWRRALSGTPALCLGSLLGLCLLSTLMALAISGGWSALGPHLGEQFQRFLVAAPLVVFVTFATSSRMHQEHRPAGKTLCWIKRKVFFSAKNSLVFLLASLLSVDLCEPLCAPFRGTADVLQIFFFVLFALVGLRWAFHDQEERCKHCLRSLATPARVGRPSHNLLEWNGTELVCKQGHGLLSVPEMETSWCQSSRWVDLDRGLDEAASV